MNAPSSIATAALHTQWSQMRASSPRITRMYCARGGTVMPSSFSTASA